MTAAPQAITDRIAAIPWREQKLSDLIAALAVGGRGDPLAFLSTVLPRAEVSAAIRTTDDWIGAIDALAKAVAGEIDRRFVESRVAAANAAALLHGFAQVRAVIDDGIRALVGEVRELRARLEVAELRALGKVGAG